MCHYYYLRFSLVFRAVFLLCGHGLDFCDGLNVRVQKAYNTFQVGLVLRTRVRQNHKRDGGADYFPVFVNALPSMLC